MQEEEAPTEADPADDPTGEDGQAEGRRSPPPPVWSGLKSIDKARAGEPTPPCINGIASVSLAPLVQRASTDR